MAQGLHKASHRLRLGAPGIGFYKTPAGVPGPIGNRLTPSPERPSGTGAVTPDKKHEIAPTRSSGQSRGELDGPALVFSGGLEDRPTVRSCAHEGRAGKGRSEARDLVRAAIRHHSNRWSRLVQLRQVQQ